MTIQAHINKPESMRPFPDLLVPLLAAQKRVGKPLS